jgi:toxin ParE1/3/4
MARISKRPAAKRDLIQHFVWLGENAGIEVARRFLHSAQKSFDDLARRPRMGPIKIHDGSLSGLRMWRVTGFEHFLIFYRPVKDGIAIERVIHAKQDYKRA